MTERTDILRCIVDLQDLAERAEARGQRRTPEAMRRAAALLARGLNEAFDDNRSAVAVPPDQP